MIETEIPRYSPSRIASELGISIQWARVLACRIVGRRRRYRLTETQFIALKNEYETYRHEPT